MSSNAKSSLFRHTCFRPMKLIISSLLFLTLSLTGAEEKKKPSDKEEKKEETKTIAAVLKDCETTDGLFPIHTDKTTGKIYLEITEKQIASDTEKPEFIHFSHTLDGVASLGLFRGQFSDSRVFSLRRHFQRIEFVAENTSFYFNPESALKRAATANVSDAILANQKIVASDKKTGRHLIEADDVFLSEFLRQLKPAKPKEEKEEKFKLGDLSKDRTRFLETKNYPDNTLFRIQYVFENLHPSKAGESDVADSRFVTIKVQHTFIEMPDNEYEPRFDDPRVGYFTTQVTDLTSHSSAPYRDFIHRWDIRKKKPGAAKSKPVEPLVWWIENTTPVELRDTIRDAVLAWNLAFEAAGIVDAVEVKIQPDDADWDADDINHHVLRWTSSPDPPFGGYGPSFVNPRTGEILGADIMLEYVFLTNRIRLNEVVNLGGRSSDVTPFASNSAARHFCQFGDCLHSNRIAGGAILRAQSAKLGNGPVEMKELVRQALTDLVLHEVGHTLGLNHNFRSSHLYDRKQIHNKELTAVTGLTGSVMDYSPINLAIDPEEQGHYYTTVPGPYDHWAIRYGYDTDDKSQKALAESTRPEHAFANDADDMRSAGRGIDPRAMINDLTSEPVEHAVDQITLIKLTLPKLVDQFPVEGESYHELRTAFASLMRDYERASVTISRFIGGVYVDRSFVGQNGAAENPFTPVSAEHQQSAIRHLTRHLFGPGAIEFSASLITRLQLQRRGFEFFDLDANEDPKVHDRILSIQKEVLNQLLHENTLERIIDSGLYGNEYDLDTMMTSLDGAIMDGDPNQEVDSFREALQIEYVNRLITISGLKETSKYPSAAQSQAILLLETRVADEQPVLSPLRHTRHIRRVIENALASR